MSGWQHSQPSGIMDLSCCLDATPLKILKILSLQILSFAKIYNNWYNDEMTNPCHSSQIHNKVPYDSYDFDVCLSSKRSQTMLWCHIARLYLLYWSTTQVKFLFIFKKMSKKCQTMVWCHIALLYVLHWSTTLVRFLFVFKKMPNNGVTPLSMIVCTALVNDPNDIFVCLHKDANVVMPNSIIVQTVLVSDPNDIFVCLQKDAKH